MRKIILSLLLATTAAAPALAADRPTREERAAAREERQADRQQSREERQDTRREARTERAESRQSPQRNVTADQRPAQVNRPAVTERVAPAFAQRQQAREQRQAQTQQSRDRWVEQANRARRQAAPTGARPDRPAPLPRTAYNHRSPQWHTTWRNDNRYDWRRWRDRHRSNFHLGVYLDPFGWGYRRYNVGWRLWPSFYSSNYWLNDPYSYRLPYAPWPYKWIRYYDDAILVDTMTGQVADVIYDFFW
jgi:Ni/Co efflux regulator RcnB